MQENRGKTKSNRSRSRKEEARIGNRKRKVGAYLENKPTGTKASSSTESIRNHGSIPAISEHNTVKSESPSSTVHSESNNNNDTKWETDRSVVEFLVYFACHRVRHWRWVYLARWNEHFRCSIWTWEHVLDYLCNPIFGVWILGPLAQATGQFVIHLPLQSLPTPLT